MTEPPWSKPFGRRCPARLTRGDLPHLYGRCDLARGHEPIPHILERGMEWICWRVQFGSITPHGDGTITWYDT